MKNLAAVSIVQIEFSKNNVGPVQFGSWLVVRTTAYNIRITSGNGALIRAIDGNEKEINVSASPMNLFHEQSASKG